ncbi:hypothetical protein Tco_0409508 [Tanacetum coccineum]
MGLPATHPDEADEEETQSPKPSKEPSTEIPTEEVAEDNWEKHEEAAASYVDLKHEIERFHDATYKAHEDTNTSLNNYEKLLTQFKTHTGKNVDKILHILKEIENAVKEDIALNKKVLEVVEAYTLNLFWLKSLLKMTILPNRPSLLPQWPGVLALR